MTDKSVKYRTEIQQVSQDICSCHFLPWPVADRASPSRGCLSQGPSSVARDFPAEEYLLGHTIAQLAEDGTVQEDHPTPLVSCCAL